MNADMAEYFPKLFETPVEETLPNGETIKIGMRSFPWIMDYWMRLYKRTNTEVVRIQNISSDDAKIYEAAVREKKQT
jgi:hypothetical protein